MAKKKKQEDFKPRAFIWQRKDQSGLMISINRTQAMEIIRGLSEQIISNDCNAGRYEFDIPLRGDGIRKERTAYISISVIPEKELEVYNA